MVVVKRRPSVSTTPREIAMSNNDRSSSSSLPFGDFRDSPKVRQGSFSSAAAPQFKAIKNSFNKPAYLPSWAIKCIVGLVVISWCLAIYWNQQLRAELKTLELEHQMESLHFQEVSKTLQEASKKQKGVEKEIQKLEETKKALEHEVRMATELKEGETLGAHHHHDIANEIEKRQAVLQEKIESLRNYIKEESHREVLEKYGPGPHRVKMTLRFTSTDTLKTMTLEMAPLDLMPHSVHIFLEMITHRLWDGSVFWHHPGVTHVATATTINYHSGEPRNHHFEQLRLGGVSFAEYTDSYPHEHYTVAFAGRGPDFYINTKNNSKSHAPGTQAHHKLDDEADPVFAKVVEGKDVVDSLLRLSAEATKNRKIAKEWKDNTLTQIVKVEIL